ncbi:MAG: 4-(cytidine 5'-diphospho)-2-C-methyl-D-erythritol kinase [Gemmatimonadota bacterium]|nr:MAG: 4-(cytidine 5'-diphospho)-2-C-methyl-D-erythritol kinase [Gemmatimonadota bacterium]
MELISYAKINLGLRVLGRRSDGYHEIETVLQTVDLCDKIELKSHPRSIRIRCDHPLVPKDEANLAFRSAHLLRETYGIRKGVEITIHKIIPVGGGMGGGSSNSAGVLRGLVNFWDLSVSPSELFSLAAQLGSDVPFFLRGGTALARGRGQDLEYFNPGWGDVGFVLIYPRVMVSSASAYKSAKISLTKNSKYVNLKSLSYKGRVHLHGLKFLIANDLEGGVARRFPIIERAKEVLHTEGASAVAMTGSGSTTYGLFVTWEEARKAAQRICSPEWDVFVTKPVNPQEEE